MSKITASDIYVIMDRIDPMNWYRFAREKLELSDNEIAECQYMDCYNLTEQRYQMIQLWIRKNGRYATMNKLKELVYSCLYQIE